MADIFQRKADFRFLGGRSLPFFVCLCQSPFPVRVGNTIIQLFPIASPARCEAQHSDRDSGIIPRADPTVRGDSGMYRIVSVRYLGMARGKKSPLARNHCFCHWWSAVGLVSILGHAARPDLEPMERPEPNPGSRELGFSRFTVAGPDSGCLGSLESHPES